MALVDCLKQANPDPTHAQPSMFVLSHEDSPPSSPIAVSPDASPRTLRKVHHGEAVREHVYIDLASDSDTLPPISALSLNNRTSFSRWDHEEHDTPTPTPTPTPHATHAHAHAHATNPPSAHPTHAKYAHFSTSTTSTFATTSAYDIPTTSTYAPPTTPAYGTNPHPQPHVQVVHQGVHVHTFEHSNPTYNHSNPIFNHSSPFNHSNPQYVPGPSASPCEVVITQASAKVCEVSGFKKRGRPSNKLANRCHACGVDKTPEWRRGEDGEHLCNACGLQYSKKKRKEKLEKQKNCISAVLNPPSDHV